MLFDHNNNYAFQRRLLRPLAQLSMENETVERKNGHIKINQKSFMLLGVFYIVNEKLLKDM